MDITYVYNRVAYSLVGIIGGRAVPDPIPLEVPVPSPTVETRDLTGNVTHQQEGSWMGAIVPNFWDWFQGDSYSLPVPTERTSFLMACLEYTAADNVATPIGYSFISFEAPEGTDTGPDAVAAPTEFQTKTVQVNYDIAADSPLQERVLAGETGPSYLYMPNRYYTGLTMVLRDFTDDTMWFAGITTSWTKGETSDTLEFAWAQEGFERPSERIVNVLNLYDERLLAGTWYMLFVVRASASQPLFSRPATTRSSHCHSRAKGLRCVISNSRRCS